MGEQFWLTTIAEVRAIRDQKDKDVYCTMSSLLI